MVTWNPIALSAMHHSHISLGAVMVESDGWQRPARYTTAQDELSHLQRDVGLCDISPSGKLLIQGEGLETYLAEIFTDIDQLQVGRVSQQDLGTGSEAQTILLARLAGDEAIVLTTSSKTAMALELLTATSERCTHLVDITSALAGVGIVGPLAQRLLATVAELDTSTKAFPDMSCAQTEVAEIHGMLLRHDVADLPNFELYFGREYGEYMWHVLMDAGEKYNTVPFGTEALAYLQ